jgi:hypothetical protein|tara:strand:- start:28 stop:471 length:444 start_codon:yes stop_codon:yes gene_type:complete
MVVEELNYFGLILSFSTVKYMLFHVFLLVLLFSLNLKDIKNYFKKIKICKKSLRFMYFIFIVALVLRLGFGTYYAPSNEMDWEFKANGKSMLEGEQIHLGRHTQGYSHLTSIFFFLFGVSNLNIFIANTIIGSLTTILVFYFSIHSL